MRICPEVSADICCFFYMYGRGAEVQPSFDYVFRTLTNRDWHISRYYAIPEPLFWFSLRLYKAAPQTSELRHLASILKTVVTERIGRDALDNPAALAIRLLICQEFGIINEEDLVRLLQLQDVDGSWNGGWFFAFGKSKIRVHHRGLTTGMAVEAIKGALGVEKGGLLMKDPKLGE